ncbi:hypothetical protein [Pseudomonas sp. TCU-HL1]|uniref:hypothetical protein n=1 Tax=Pseudomonas sp. TCU-HL1 TaxID=1856685 RepID=UPI0008561EE1|nr:hypothetical protein [Pseudomonas sp. TCU-HL1]AOE85913.1 hypothetical protein THL1_3365 [Pseudomonas sp. TCU-HL1]
MQFGGQFECKRVVRGNAIKRSSEAQFRNLEYKDLNAKSLYIEGKLSKVAADLVRACFDDDELTPESIGQVAWYPQYLDMIFDSSEGDLISVLGRQCWLSAVHASNRHVSMLERGLNIPVLAPRVMIMQQAEAPKYLDDLVKHLKSADVLFVAYHDHKTLIRQYYPDSVIIMAAGLTTDEITTQVMARIRPIIGR